jgi:hypothetical protein
VQLPAPGGMGWLAAVALGFIVIHVVAGAISLRASANGDTVARPEAVSPLYD